MNSLLLSAIVVAWLALAYRWYGGLIDRRIVRMLKKRYQLVRSVGKVKRSRGLEVRQPDREAEVLDRVTGLVEVPEAREFVASVYRAMFKASYLVEDES